MMPCCNAVSRGASVFCSKRAGAGRYIQEIWALHRDLCLLKIFKLRFNKACLLLIFDTCSDQSRSCILGWVGNCLVFFSLGIFFGFPVLTIFHAICSILELETAISTVCATVLSSNLSFSIVFSTVFATVCSMFCPFSMLFAAFLSWNLHFHRMCNILQLHSSQYLQDFGAEG